MEIYQMPFANQLINKAVEFIQEGTIHECTDNPIHQHITAAEVVAAVPRPRQVGAAQAVHAATFAHETPVQQWLLERLWQQVGQLWNKLDKP
jgi:hypothetical protein